MKLFQVSVICATLAVLLVDSASAEATKCKTPIHYKELGCTPVTKEGEECPSSYNCGHLKAAEVNATNCHFRGKEYAEFQGPEQELLPPCVPYALCNGGGFQAGHYDCGPLFQRAGDVCENIRSDCCPRIVCGEELAKVHVCYMEGEKFHAGEKRSPKEDPCMVCKCDEHFDNSTDVYQNKNCKSDDCFIDFWYNDDLSKGCAPKYYGKDRCCPSTTKCPTSDDKLIKATEPHANTDLKCKFGDLELNLGDKVNDSDNCMDCTCLTPPLVECHRREGCERVFN